jgi:hypothetical protein
VAGGGLSAVPRRRTWLLLLIGAVVLAAVLTPIVFDFEVVPR